MTAEFCIAHSRQRQTQNLCSGKADISKVSLPDFDHPLSFALRKDSMQEGRKAVS